MYEHLSINEKETLLEEITQQHYRALEHAHSLGVARLALISEMVDNTPVNDLPPAFGPQ